jgi:hypothetical protein
VPFLKFSRDKRGYEYFSLVEAVSGRHGKPRTRVLFWFRTPPQVKVGREPFTEEVRRAIETQNPGMKFDWPRLMTTPLPAPDVEHWRERRRLERAARQAAREPDEAEVGEQSEPGQPAEIVESDQSVVPADTTLSASESPEPSPLVAASSAVVAVVAAPGGRRRRRRRGRRTPNLQAGTAPSPVVPNVPGLPSEDV